MRGSSRDNCRHSGLSLAYGEQESSLYLSILPSDALQAGVIVDLMLEFEESRFVCITTKKSRDDALLSYLLQYTANIGHQATSPRCIILRENSLLEDLGTGLAAISNSGVRLIVVHFYGDP